MQRETHCNMPAPLVQLDSVRDKVATIVDACTVAPQSHSAYENGLLVRVCWPAQSVWVGPRESGIARARTSPRFASNRALNYPPELILFKATNAFWATEAGSGR